MFFMIRIGTGASKSCTGAGEFDQRGAGLGRQRPAGGDRRPVVGCAVQDGDRRGEGEARRLRRAATAG
jgi:hypothetical protein